VKTQPPQARRGKVAPEFFSADVAKARRFYLDLNPPKIRPLVVVCGGVEHCTPDYTIHREAFPYYSIEYVVHGRGEVKLKGKNYPLQPGCLFSYGTNTPHHITGDMADPLVKYFVDFTGTKAPALLHACGLTAGHVSAVVPPNALQPLFDELIQVGMQVRRGNKELCARLLECLALRIKGAGAPIGGAETLAHITYQHCRRHIEQHSLRLRTLDQIAGECHVTNAYLCRLFQRYDNQTPYQYLLRLKMHHAAGRLQQPGALVKLVAAETGFLDPFHFSRVFSSVFGISPAAFGRLR